MIRLQLIAILSITMLAAQAQQEFDPLDFQESRKAQRLYNRAVALVNGSDYHKALPLIDSALAIKPQFPEAYNEKGKVYHQLERYDDAMAEFEKAIDLLPTFGEALFNIAFTSFTKDTSMVSASDFSKSIDAGFNEPFAYYYRGLLELLHKDYNAAIADFSIAIELDPEYAKAYHDRATSKFRLDDFQGAIYDYRLAVTYAPEMKLAYINMGHVKKRIGDFQGAKRDYEVCINLDSLDYRGYLNRGVAHFILGEVDLAESDFLKAKALAEESAAVLINLANVLVKKGEIKEALELYGRSLEINPNLPEAYINRGLAYENLGRLEEACEDWHKALSLGYEEAENFHKECLD